MDPGFSLSLSSCLFLSISLLFSLTALLCILLSVSVSRCSFLSVSRWFSLSLYVYLSVCVFFLFLCPSLCLSMSISLSLYLTVPISFFLFLSLSLTVSVCLSLSQSFSSFVPICFVLCFNLFRPPIQYVSLCILLSSLCLSRIGSGQNGCEPGSATQGTAL